jgi:hypothetical protein
MLCFHRGENRPPPYEYAYAYGHSTSTNAAIPLQYGMGRLVALMATVHYRAYLRIFGQVFSSDVLLPPKDKLDKNASSSDLSPTISKISKSIEVKAFCNCGDGQG